jgi:hypothetical protein
MGILAYFKPEKFMFWTEKKDKNKGIVVYSLIALLFFVMAIVMPGKKTDQQIANDKMMEDVLNTTRSIPGLEAVDVYANLTAKGFKMEQRTGGVLKEWKCSSTEGNNEYTVEIFGKSPTEITAVNATAMNIYGANNDMKHFFGYVASIPYDGADQERAKTWVSSNINSNTSTVIGGVKYEVFAKAPRVRMLRIVVEE